MNRKSGLLVLLMAALMTGLMVIGGSGCAEQHERPYGVERTLSFPARHGEIWAVAPVLNLSGYQVDPLLQADLLYMQLQQVQGLTVIPVNRVAEAYATLNIDKVQSADDAERVCAALGCDRLVVATITAYDPYLPPKIGASLQLIGPGPGSGDGARQASADVRASDNRASDVAPADVASADVASADLRPANIKMVRLEDAASFLQVVGMFDAANGSVRDALLAYAAGRNDPAGPMGTNEYFASIDRYCGFVYHELIVQVLQRKSWDEWKR